MRNCLRARLKGQKFTPRILVIRIKGSEENSGKTMSQVIGEELGSPDFNLTLSAQLNRKMFSM